MLEFILWLMLGLILGFILELILHTRPALMLGLYCCLIVAYSLVYSLWVEKGDFSWLGGHLFLFSAIS